MIPVALTIAGSDSGGSAGIQADLKTFSALGVHGCSVITALTAQNTMGVREVHPVPLEFIEAQLDAVLEDLDVRAFKTGMLYSSEVMDLVYDRMKDSGVNFYVLDPVMIAASGSRLVREGEERSLRKLASIATVVTPNKMEAEFLAGIKIESEEDMIEAARRILKIGCEAVLVKGGHLGGDTVVDVLATSDGYLEVLRSERIEVPPLHGSGCTLSAAITAYLARGYSVLDSIKLGREFVLEAIRRGYVVGKGGLHTVNPGGKVLDGFERFEALDDIRRALEILESCEKISLLIPEVGSNVARAIENARTREDVVGVRGRIRRDSRGRLLHFGFWFGEADHTARLVLAARSLDPRIRAVMNIRFDELIVDLCRMLGLRVVEIDRSREPPEGSTMDWAVREAFSILGEVPDVIYDRGAPGKEPMVRILGRSAVEVAKRVCEIAEKYHQVSESGEKR